MQDAITAAFSPCEGTIRPNLCLRNPFTMVKMADGKTDASRDLSVTEYKRARHPR